MHFNSSCSYTALAVLLTDKGIDTEDTEIALRIGLPWLFTRDGDSFLAGPMLQGSEWFDIYLNPLGLCMTEEFTEKTSLPDHLRSHGLCMLGIRLPGGIGKHAVVFTGYDGVFHFYNPPREGSKQPPEISMTEEELLSSIDDITVTGSLGKHPAAVRDLTSALENSVAVLRENYLAIERFGSIPHSETEYKNAMDTLFRSVLLDGISMLELAGETDLADAFRQIQKDFLTFMKSPKTGLLSESISLADLKGLIEMYVRLIKQRIREAVHPQRITSDDIRNIHLVPMTEEMYHRYFQDYENDPDLYLNKADYVSYTYTPEKVAKYIQRQIDLKRETLAVMCGKETVGEIIIKNIEEHKCATLGIALKNAYYKDLGIGTEAERLAVRYVFEELDIPLLYADSVRTNTRSQHVLEKLGFKLIGEDSEFRYYSISR